MQPTQMQDVTRDEEVLAVSLELASKSWKVGLDDGKRKSPAVHGVDHARPEGRLEEAIAVIEKAKQQQEAEAAQAYQWTEVDGIRVRYARRGDEAERTDLEERGAQRHPRQVAFLDRELCQGHTQAGVRMPQQLSCVRLGGCRPE